MIEINFFKTSNGRCPIEEFLDSLTSKQAQKITWVMQLIEELDKRVPKQYFKKLVDSDDIWEVRAQFGSNIFRILGFFVDDHKLILPNGFWKKTDNTPVNEIALAEKRKYEYLKKYRGQYERFKKIH